MIDNGQWVDAKPAPIRISGKDGFIAKYGTPFEPFGTATKPQRRPKEFPTMTVEQYGEWAKQSSP